jgi:hypothetical protein
LNVTLLKERDDLKKRFEGTVLHVLQHEGGRLVMFENVGDREGPRNYFMLATRLASGVSMTG